MAKINAYGATRVTQYKRHGQPPLVSTWVVTSDGRVLHKEWPCEYYRIEARCKDVEAAQNYMREMHPDAIEVS